MLKLTAEQQTALDALRPFDGVYSLTRKSGMVERFSDTDKTVVAGGVSYPRTDLVATIPQRTGGRDSHSKQTAILLGFAGKKTGFFDSAQNPINYGHSVVFGFAWEKADGTYTAPLLSIPWKSNAVWIGNDPEEGIYTMMQFVSPMVQPSGSRSIWMAENWMNARNRNTRFFRNIADPAVDDWGRG